MQRGFKCSPEGVILRDRKRSDMSVIADVNVARASIARVEKKIVGRRIVDQIFVVLLARYAQSLSVDRGKAVQMRCRVLNAYMAKLRTLQSTRQALSRDTEIIDRALRSSPFRI